MLPSCSTTSLCLTSSHSVGESTEGCALSTFSQVRGPNFLFLSHSFTLLYSLYLYYTLSLSSLKHSHSTIRECTEIHFFNIPFSPLNTFAHLPPLLFTTPAKFIVVVVVVVDFYSYCIRVLFLFIHIFYIKLRAFSTRDFSLFTVY